MSAQLCGLSTNFVFISAHVVWSHAFFWCSWVAEQDGYSLEELVDSWYLLICDGGRVLADYLHGPHLSLLTCPGHTAKMLSGDYFHRILQVQGV